MEEREKSMVQGGGLAILVYVNDTQLDANVSMGEQDAGESVQM